MSSNKIIGHPSRQSNEMPRFAQKPQLSVYLGSSASHELIFRHDIATAVVVIYYYEQMCFFGTSAFSFFPADSFLVLLAPWQAGSPPGPRAQFWALAEVRGTCSGGLRWQVPSGRDSRHVDPTRPMQTHVHTVMPTIHFNLG